MGVALRATGRDIVYELSTTRRSSWGSSSTPSPRCAAPRRYRGRLGAHPIDAAKQTWALGVRDIWLQHNDWRAYNRRGHWNMPCPLRVGQLGGWDLKPLRPTRLTPDEQYSHLSLWCLWSAPIIIGCPLERLDAFTLSLLCNDEVLAVDQDALGLQARQLEVEGGEALVKELEDGSWAVGLFNVGETAATVTAGLSDLGLPGPLRVRDLWRQAELGIAADRLSFEVARHGVRLVRVSQASVALRLPRVRLPGWVRATAAARPTSSGRALNVVLTPFRKAHAARLAGSNAAPTCAAATRSAVRYCRA